MQITELTSVFLRNFSRKHRYFYAAIAFTLVGMPLYVEAGLYRKNILAQERPETEVPRSKELIRAVATPRITTPVSGVYLVEGLILVEGGRELHTIHREHGIHIDLGKGDYSLLHKQLEPYLNYPLNIESIQQIKATIVDYFLKEKNQYVAAIVPVQEVSDQVLVLEILEGAVGEITYRGQKWFSPWALQRGLEVKKGDPIIEKQLLDYLTWVNRNPFHHLQLILQPGRTKGTTDIEFMSQERFPVRFFSGADNTGFIANGGQTRLYAGFNWGNALQIGDLLSYQYTSSVNFHGFQSHVVNYSSFLSWKHLFTIFGCYGQVYPTIPDFTTVGKNLQGSIRYDIPIKPLYGDFRTNAMVGFDFKYQNSNLFFAGNAAEVSAVIQTINVTQFLFSYSFQKNWTNQAINCETQLVTSLWKDWWIPYQTSFDYNALRENSHVRYAYLKFSLTDSYSFPGDWIIATQFRMQIASQTLPSSEEFALGGANTVRGYYEQQFLADNAFCFNIEAYSPPLSLFNAVRNELTFLLFFDYGYGRGYSAVSPPYISQNLVGIGPGMRYDIVPYLSLKADYGFQVLGIPLDHRFGRFHLSITASY